MNFRKWIILDTSSKHLKILELISLGKIKLFSECIVIEEKQ